MFSSLATVDEMELAISKVDPKKTISVGNFRFDDGSSKTIPLVKSEMYLTELMDEICDKMDDYAKARYKKNGRLTVLKLMSETGGMNPLMSEVDFVQDGDLNKSLKHFCLEVLEDNEEHVLKLFSEDNKIDNMEVELCSNRAGYCDEKWTDDEEYELEADESKDEL